MPSPLSSAAPTDPLPLGPLPSGGGGPLSQKGEPVTADQPRMLNDYRVTYWKRLPNQGQRKATATVPAYDEAEARRVSRNFAVASEIISVKCLGPHK